MKLTDLFPTPTLRQKIVQKTEVAMSDENYEVHHVPLQRADQRSQEAFKNK